MNVYPTPFGRDDLDPDRQPGWELREAELVVVQWFRLLDPDGASTGQG